MGYAEGPTARSAPRRLYNRSESWELCAESTTRRRAAVSCAFLGTHQFRMQFPLTILLVYVSSHRCVTCVLELHATLWSEPAHGRPGEGWVFRTVYCERVVLSSPGCLWPGRMDDRDKLRARFGWRWCLRSPRAPQPPQPGSVDQVARWRETPVAFARWYLCGIETVIAFAGEKWAFLLRFLGAEVSSVSAALCWGCAVVLLVSRSPCF